MKAPKLVAQLREHGGIARIHVHPARGLNDAGELVDGWANTVVCKDGFRRQLTTIEHGVLARWGPVNLPGAEEMQ